MSIRPHSLRAFLASSRLALQNAIRNESKVTFVVGNESADLDSITSSILYAYLQTSAAQQSQNTDALPRVPYIPLCNIPQEDVHIRRDLLALLPHAHLEPSYLLTISDLPTAPAAAQNLIHSLILVDHNNPAGPLASLLGHAFAVQKLEGCIDHHVDERIVPPRAFPRRIVNPCGSCTSLVMLHFQGAWDTLTAAASDSRIAGGQDDAYTGVDDGAARRAWDVGLAKLALGPVTIDTRNLTDESKVTTWDEQAAAMLEARVGIKEPRWDRKKFWKSLSVAKKDLSGFTFDEVLRKDYKEYEGRGGVKMGIASVVKGVAWLADTAKGDLTGLMQKFKDTRGLATLVIGTHFTDDNGRRRRELVVLGDLVNQVQSGAVQELGLEQSEHEGSFHAESSTSFKVWEQTKTDMSRKQIAPLLKGFMV